MDIDWKKLGLGAKDVLVGVVTVAGGATGGAAGAQGGQQAGKGLDKILGMAGVTEDEPAPPVPSRGQRVEQHDFTARKAAVAAQYQASRVSAAESVPAETAIATVQRRPDPESQRPVVFRQSVPEPAAAPTASVPKRVAQDLAALGYTDAEVAAIASGSWRPVSEGRGVDAVSGTRIAQQDGRLAKSEDGVPADNYEGSAAGGGIGSLLKSLFGTKEG